MKILKTNIDAMDYYIFIPYIMLSVIGIIMVYSASSNIATQIGGSPTGYLIRQSMFVVFSLIIVLICLCGQNMFVRNGRVLFIFWAAMFIGLIWLKAFGHSVNGAAGWIPIGPLHIQPAETAKVYIILVMSNILANHENELINNEKTKVITHSIFVFVMLGLILIQPDLGGTIINALIFIVIIFASGMNWKGATLISSSMIVGGWIILKTALFIFRNGSSNYQVQRILAYGDPFRYEQGIGHQLVNSYYALSNGGIFGVGLGNSIQKTGYLPEPNTDFIMSVISEELGLVGVLLILSLLFIIIVKAFQLGIRSNNTYDTLVSYGIGTYLLVQSYFNIGGVIGLLPITGVTFPFISYGGSSMLTLALCIGMLLVISAKQKIQRKHKLN
ncbi:FtsW/RodA/SpoVE family cell cycle protein [Apilactobacillus sp.]|uniref:FtsW/RodA/SpoVE family cell cycle protein n=1 Tax=Apilactobacillus sp. TaxID=2767901 RepID=UPI0025F6F3FB|nr:FtsW/RodA/SpoVE family cell cycle protein [Apilactobacillus sp.]